VSTGREHLLPQVQLVTILKLNLNFNHNLPEQEIRIKIKFKIKRGASFHSADPDFKVAGFF
jgi:hypothetical protein